MLLLFGVQRKIEQILRVNCKGNLLGWAVDCEWKLAAKSLKYCNGLWVRNFTICQLPASTFLTQSKAHPSIFGSNILDVVFPPAFFGPISGLSA